MAMSKKGQIRKLCQIAPPDIAVVTCIALVHAENFESIEGIAEAKGEILLHPKTKLGIVPENFPDFGSCEKRHAAPIEVPAAFPFPGAHHRYNFRIAAACAEALGMSSAEILEAVPKLKLPDNRFQMVEKNGVLFINDAYNAATASVRAALESLPQPQGEGRRMAVLSGLFELGKFTEQCHREVASISLDCLDRLFCLGEECRSIVDEWKEKGREAELCMSREEIVEALKKTMVPGDVILLKGANKKQLWKVLEEIE
jgi:UDP-N-acetylmuramoyl-tripeptide--D-alanyl-D-alanine ligase